MAINLLKRKRKTESGTPSIHLFNTKTKKKEVFKSLRDGSVHMYNCGPTVHNFQHIGNLRPYVFADILRRTLEYANYTVKQVINITDIGHLSSNADDGEDKMLAALRREGLKETRENLSRLAQSYEKVFLEDLSLLFVQPPAQIARASEHIPDQIALLKTLDEKGYTYETPDGVYFDTSRFPSYGVLTPERSGADALPRIIANKDKRNQSDFSLWKFSKLGWESPWGTGFPGWHLECSAMSMKYLGRTFDIHTGGIDHISIHHNNEIAQSEAATGKPLARYWLHNEFVTIEGRKIAKSIGNTVYLRNVIDRGFSPLALRYWFLTGHYRTPMNFTWDAIEASQTTLFRLTKFFVEQLGTTTGEVNTRYKEAFVKTLFDDLNTPQGLSILWDLIHDETVPKEEKRATILDIDTILSLGLAHADKQHLSIIAGKELRLSIEAVPKQIQRLAHEREEARKGGDWGKADKLREKVASEGFLLEDTAEGPVFKRIEDK